MKTCGLGLKILRQGQSGSSDGGEFPDESSDMQVDNVADSAFQYMRLRVATLSSVIARMAAHTTELRSLRMQHLARVGGDGLRGSEDEEVLRWRFRMTQLKGLLEEDEREWFECIEGLEGMPSAIIAAALE